MLLDHIVFCLLMAPPIFIANLVFGSGSLFQWSSSETIVFYSGVFVYLNKDIVMGQSFGKRITGFRIVDRTSGLPADEFQCLIRNITIPVWPLEVVLVLFSPSRRLGDMMANTLTVIDEKSPPTSIFRELCNQHLSMRTLYTIIVGAAYVTALWLLMNHFFPINSGHPNLDLHKVFEQI